MERCKNETLPGMTLCYEHATREAMAYYIRLLYKKLHPEITFKEEVK